MLSTRSLSLFLLLLPSTSAASLRAAAEEGVPLEALSLFRAWSDTHGKEYDSPYDNLNVWLANNERIEAHNNQDPKPSFTLGHNAFSDMTNDEFAMQYNLGQYSNAEFSKMEAQEKLSPTAESVSRRLDDKVDLPDYVNWAQMGGVTPVKNQGSCGSCWAFSTTGALEGAKFVATGELLALSEQNLLDCDHTDLGCNGGLMDNAFKFDEKTGGLCSEADYPYEAKQNKICNTNCTDVPGTIVKTFYDVPPGDEKAMLAAVSMQPISVAIQADQFVFQFYKTGVLTDSSCGSAGNIDHGVLAIGYGTDLETQEPYFLVKNSWGAAWGEAGYIRLGRKTDNEFGMCAILKMASYPEVIV
jgi:C1A family cysteine protease